MKALGLDGREYPFNLKDKSISKRSKLHIRAINILKEIFPKTSFTEEVSIKIKSGTTLYLDIYIPIFNLAVEVDGKQHEEYTSHFHKDKMSFYRSQKKDAQKEEWCHINNIKLVRLKESSTDDEWRTQIRKAVQ